MKVPKRKSKDKRLFIGFNMPPLYRRKPGEEYDFKKDEVLKWISQRPALMDYIFNKLSLGGYIVYNPITKKWHGTNYEPGDENND